MNASEGIHNIACTGVTSYSAYTACQAAQYVPMAKMNRSFPSYLPVLAAIVYSKENDSKTLLLFIFSIRTFSDTLDPSMTTLLTLQ